MTEHLRRLEELAADLQEVHRELARSVRALDRQPELTPKERDAIAAEPLPARHGGRR